jgi:formylglycine-generating enzyme required for sulfatase activity
MTFLEMFLNGFGTETDPTGSSSGAIKLCRGGSWHNGMPNGMSRSSFRGWMDTPYLYSSTMGIRVVRLAN